MLSIIGPDVNIIKMEYSIHFPLIAVNVISDRKRRPRQTCFKIIHVTTVIMFTSAIKVQNSSNFSQHIFGLRRSFPN